MKLVDFVIPTKSDDAHRQLRELGDDAIVAAGCTAFHFYANSSEKKAVLISKLGLTGIKTCNDTFTIGATTSLSDLLHYRADGWVLDRVARQVASHQIRNISTIGGNIARVFPWADFPVALLALGGSVTISDGNEKRNLNIDVYFKAQPASLYNCGDLLTEITIPVLPANTGFGHIKQRMKSEAFSLATVSACLTVNGNSITDARIATGASVGFPSRLSALEEAVCAMTVDSLADALPTAIDTALSGTSFLKKEGMTPEYIKHLTAVSIADAIQAAACEAQGGEV